MVHAGGLTISSLYLGLNWSKFRARLCCMRWLLPSRQQDCTKISCSPLATSLDLVLDKVFRSGTLVWSQHLLCGTKSAVSWKVRGNRGRAGTSRADTSRADTSRAGTSRAAYTQVVKAVYVRIKMGMEMLLQHQQLGILGTAMSSC